MTVNIQTDWHKSILKGYSKPSGLYEFVTNTYPKGTCVAIDKSDEDRSERKKIYAYYLHDYKYQRMGVEEWLNKCDGPYLTFTQMQSKDYRAIGREVASGFLVYEKNSRLKDINIGGSSKSSFYLNVDNSRCVLDGCIEWNYVNNDLGFTKVGLYNATGLETQGEKGYLLYGPYAPIKAGEYKISVTGKYLTDTLEDKLVELRVTGNRGADIYVKAPIFDDSRQKAVYELNLERDISDLEVVLFTPDKVRYSVQSYSLTRR